MSSINAEAPLTNYVAYRNPQTQRDCIGHYDLSKRTIQPLSFKSGTPISNLYQVIEAGTTNVTRSGNPISISSIQILPPLAARDILCVGKNYFEHAKEFNSSGFDSSDKVDVPSHPVIFTKRYTSIIADGEEIWPHPEFTQTCDYEGEIGVIVGKKGFRIREEDAMEHVWGYTIVNDVTARERQRDHKQFYIGKSPDTFCPMVRLSSILALERRLVLMMTRAQLLFQLQTLTKCCAYRPTSTASFDKMPRQTISFSQYPT